MFSPSTNCAFQCVQPELSYKSYEFPLYYKYISTNRPFGMRIQWKEKNHTHTHLHPQTTLENAYPRYRKLKTLLPVPCSKTPRKSTSRSTSDNTSYKQSSQSIVVVVIDRTSLFKTNVRRKNKSYLQNRFEKMESSVLISTRHKQTTEKLKLKPTTASRQFAPVYFPLLLLQSTFHLHQPLPTCML